MKVNKILYSSDVNVSVTNQICYPVLKGFLSDVSSLYPGFDAWLNFKVRRFERNIVLACHNDSIVGVSILKDSESEKKISTFYVAPDFRGQGIGQALMSKSLQLLDSYDTFITVSEERNIELFPLLQRNGFVLDKAVPDLYRLGKDELFYRLP
jgi:GNAT superfamily N-acetyltransferase